MTRPDRSMLCKAALAAVLALSLTVVAAGCGEKQETVGGETKQDLMTLLLDWTPNPNHAGVYTGIAKERFSDVGLDVKVETPSDPAAVIQQVAAGRADVGISYQNEVMAARDKGAKVKAVAAIVSTPLNSMIWLKSSGIDSVKDLKGKKVGTSGGDPSAFLKTILEKNDVDPKSVKDINVGYDLLPALLSKKVDAVIGVYGNVEGVTLQQKKRPATVLPVDKAGVPPYDELVLVASESALADGKKSDKIRRFIAGLERGTQDAVADPKAAATAILAADKTLDADFVDKSLAVTLPLLLLTKNSPNPYGYLDPAKWESFANWMRDNELLENQPDAPAAYSNELLPGQPPK